MVQPEGKPWMPLGEALKDLVDRVLPPDPFFRRQLVFETFRSAAGPAVSRQCVERDVREGVLHVEVLAPCWLEELEGLRGAILEKVNLRLPRSLRLAEIRFHHPRDAAGPGVAGIL